MALLQLRNLHKFYRSRAGVRHVLRGVDLAVEEGEFLAITGSSGSGKSTILNILGCLDTPDVGEYWLEGKCLDRRSGWAVRGRRVAMVFQSFELIPRLTVLENAELPLRFARVPPTERRRLAVEALGRVGLAGRAGEYPDRLSGGEQQRVAVARVLTAVPMIVLADEPTGNLDRETGTAVMELFRELNREGRTVVMVTHDPNFLSYVSRVVAVREGRIALA